MLLILVFKLFRSSFSPKFGLDFCWFWNKDLSLILTPNHLILVSLDSLFYQLSVDSIHKNHAYLGEKAPSEIWHNRLGHPHFWTLQNILKNIALLLTH